MATAKALEFNGKLTLVDRPTPVEQLWCMAKHNDMNNQHWSNLWWCHKKYGCEYFPDVMKKISEIDRRVYDGLFKKNDVERDPCTY